jgi:hypothetical protein
MKRLSNVHKFKIASVLMAAILIGAVGYTLHFISSSWDDVDAAYQASTQSQTVVVDPKQMASIVEDTQNGSDDLVAYLRSQNQGCTPSQTGTAWYRVVKEVNNSQAMVEFGCTRTYNAGSGSPARMLVHVVGNKWQFISPTDQWDYDVPSCSMLQTNHILATLEPICWTKWAVGNGATATVIPNQISQFATSYATCAVAEGSHVSKEPVGICITKDGVTFTQK